MMVAGHVTWATSGGVCRRSKLELNLCYLGSFALGRDRSRRVEGDVRDGRSLLSTGAIKRRRYRKT